MARITQQELEGLLGLSSGTNTTFAREAAALIVDEELVGKSMTDARLKLIELYLAAHFYETTKGGQVQSEKIGEASVTYRGVSGEALRATLHGQTAISLDTSGTLDTKGRPRASFQVL